MIHLMHGPDVVSSREALARMRSGSSVVTILDSRSLKTEEIWERLQQGSLLDNGLTVLDWFEEKFLPQKFPHLATDLVVWSAQTFTKTNWADKVSLFRERGSQSVFKLADSLGLRQTSPSQVYLEKTLSEKNPPEVILSLLARQLKLIALSREGKTAEVSKSSFIQEKIGEQAIYWSEKALKRAFRVLLEADLAIKNGLDPEIVLSLALAKINP